jgi:hypothetical protein
MFDKRANGTQVPGTNVRSHFLCSLVAFGIEIRDSRLIACAINARNADGDDSLATRLLLDPRRCMLHAAAQDDEVIVHKKEALEGLCACISFFSRPFVSIHSLETHHAA